MVIDGRPKNRTKRIYRERETGLRTATILRRSTSVQDAFHVHDPVASVYRDEDRVTVVVVVVVARVERSFEYTIRMCGIRMRGKGADHVCDPLRVTLLFPARARTASTLRGAGDSRASPPSAEPSAIGGPWPRPSGVAVRRSGRVGGVYRPTYTPSGGR